MEIAGGRLDINADSDGIDSKAIFILRVVQLIYQ